PIAPEATNCLTFRNSSPPERWAPTPIEFLFAVRIWCRATPATLLVILRTGLDVGAHRSASHAFLTVKQLSIGPEVQCGLEIRFGRFGGGLGDGPSIFDRVRKRGFAPDLFAGGERVDGDLFVRVRRRGDEDALNLFVGEKLLVIGVAFGFGRFF